MRALRQHRGAGAAARVAGAHHCRAVGHLGDRGGAVPGVQRRRQQALDGHRDAVSGKCPASPLQHVNSLH